MRAEYNFANGRKNPYTNQMKRQITINVGEEVLNYFKTVAENAGIHYQALINLYLTDSAKNKR